MGLIKELFSSRSGRDEPGDDFKRVFFLSDTNASSSLRFFMRFVDGYSIARVEGNGGGGGGVSEAGGGV